MLDALNKDEMRIRNIGQRAQTDLVGYRTLSVRPSV